MTWAACRLPSRRDVLAGGGLLALTGCLPGSDQAAPPVDPELRTRARIAEEVRALARHYDAVMDRFPAARADLATLAAEHEVHAQALLGPAPTRPTPSSTATPSPPVPDVPDNLDAALGSLVAAERAASLRRSRQAGQSSPAVARLLASVAGCEAAHAALLSPPSGSS